MLTIQTKNFLAIPVSSISKNTISTLHAEFYLKRFLFPALKVCGESQGPNS
jgi:hypothetical protein